jgi:hypothetical protein
MLPGENDGRRTTIAGHTRKIISATAQVFPVRHTDCIKNLKAAGSKRCKDPALETIGRPARDKLRID